ncbi:MAG: efflux RND transporter periplasmic adaptor subunit [Ignavibacteria bacterium]|nr:efflux RND transporter periplasmic adaptor subunit [Ignavibacteria bacterium]
MRKLFLISGVTLLLLSVFSGCSKKNNNTDTDNMVNVITTQVKKLTVNRVISVSGNIEGRKTVKLGFLVSGKINSIPFDEGSMVKQGEMVASIDPESYRLGFEIANAGLNQATDEYNRLNKMHEKGSLSESDYEKISNTLKQATSQQKLAAKNLADTKLYSPINGVILKRISEPGEVVGTGYPVYVVSDISTIKVTASVPEAELRYIQKGQITDIYIPAIEEHLSGKISEIGAVADPYTRTYTIKIEMSNPGLKLRPGMIAELKITSATKVEIISIPGESILRDLDRTTYVYVADPSKNRAYKRLVSVGNPYENNIEITKGLSENELVVTGGQQNITDGASIKAK